MGPRSSRDVGRRATTSLLDVIAVGYFAAFVGQVVDWRLLNLPTLPTGGDMASHVLYAWTTGIQFFPNGRLTGWMPEVFAGFPALSYYFPLPFVVAAALAKLIGFGEGLKWATMLPSFLLPGVAYVIVRRVFRLHYLSALTAGFAVLACLVQDENAIWGGNLLGVLAGEFAYTYGELFALIAMAAWVKASESPRGWMIAGLFEALVGVSHGYPLLVTGFSTLTLFVLDRDVRRTSVLLIKGHALAFCLIAGWLWPMLEMHGYTVPNDGAVSISAWRELLPKALWPTALLGASGLGLWLLPATRRPFPSMAARSVIYFASAAAIAAVGWLSADSIGLADIRFFPLVWLLGGVAAAIVFGESIVALSALARRPAATMVAPAAVAAILMLGQAAWLSADVSSIQTWAYWNYSGYENKPQWQNLSRLFPAMTGKLGSPRLVFEHDPANNDLGSTRSLEALPMFLGGRPVLEGLYMESALLAPEVYWLQSEISAKPSSPLGRFPSSALDPAAAARHMDWLYADTILLRSDEAKAAVTASGLFDLIAEAPPFALCRLRGPPPELVVPVSGPLVPAPRDGWMENAYDWFRSTRGGAAPPLPYYPGPGQTPIASASSVMTVPEVNNIALDRDELRFTVSAIGRPYLVKMAFHDRWQLATPGSLYLAAPGFMLVVPAERTVVLRYGITWAGRMGEVASALAFLLLIVLLIRPNAQDLSPGRISVAPRPVWCVAAWLAVLAGIGSALYLHSPNRSFGNGLEAMNRQHYAEAAEWFGRAAETRRGRARREEALFWQAKATEMAGNKAAALHAYTRLIGRFDGYWLPEALYTASVLADQVGDPISARTWRDRLRSAYPNDRWALRAGEIAPQ